MFYIYNKINFLKLFNLAALVTPFIGKGDVVTGVLSLFSSFWTFGLGITFFTIFLTITFFEG